MKDSRRRELKKKMEFEITENHLKLAKNFVVDWCYDEYGAPCIDPKRPYGNSDVDVDISEILSVELESKEDGYYIPSEKQSSKFRNIYEEMMLVLEIWFTIGQIKTGKFYRNDEYDYRGWKECIN